MKTSFRSGTLYIVSTPIGNLEDITIRAVKVLSGVDIIAAEDTRKSQILLKHYGINKPLVSYFSHNEKKMIPRIMNILKGGQSVAIVSEAGTPGISDPAVGIIRAAIADQVSVVAVPGPTAFLPALISSGLPCDKFIFIGFLPQKKRRKSVIERLSHEQKTIIIYESPHRLLKTLTEIMNVFGDRKVAVARELTKIFEEVIHGRLKDAIAYFSNTRIRGEFVVVIGGN